MCLREAHIPNLSLLLCLEAFEKFLVGRGGVGWSRPVLGFSLSQAEQKEESPITLMDLSKL